MFRIVAQRDECTQGDSPDEGDQIWMLFLNKTGNVKRARNVEGYERVARGCSKKEEIVRKAKKDREAKGIVV